MRTARLKEEGKAYYHCITRIVGRHFLLDEKEFSNLLSLLDENLKIDVSSQKI